MHFPVILTEEQWKSVEFALKGWQASYRYIDIEKSSNIATAIEVIENAQENAKREQREAEGYKNNNWMAGERKDR